MIFPWFYCLKEEEQLLLEGFTKKWTINGPGTFFVKPFVSAKRRRGISLLPTQFVKIKNLLSGEITVKKGPCFFFLEAYEEIKKQQDVYVLQHNEYMKVIDQTTGKIRVVTGPNHVVLEPNEEVLNKPTRGINIDEHTAVLVRNTSNGSLRLVTENKVFFPAAEEEIEEVRRRILLESHESVIIKDKDGKYQIIEGSKVDESFFLQPYQELLQLRWSSGINKENRDLIITHIDARPKFMWYEFGVRTKDNVELILGVTFFWQIVDVDKMVRTTDDAPGDICSHARSMIIQSVSKSPLENFLDSFNDVVRAAIINEDDPFYQQRGVKIHSVEVRSVTCKEASTQQILQEIIQETTNRLNRLQKQQSENEVRLNQVKGNIDIEKQKADLLEIKKANALKEAESSGEAEAAKVATFFDKLAGTVKEKEKLAIFNTLKKVEYIDKLGNSKASMFFTPQDVDLRIEAKPGQ
jgi:regulator of protease activity HflC (stomatin/prohibitin superfamily)